VPSFKVKFSGVTILQGVELSIFLLIFEWALQQCSATALPVILIKNLHKFTSRVVDKKVQGQWIVFLGSGQ